MRKKWNVQLSICHIMPKNQIGRELGAICEIIDANPQIVELVYKDIAGASRVDTGRSGMTAEQVLRCAVLKQYRNLTYEELAFHLQDSRSFRSFARLQMGQTPGGSTLQDNIKAITEETWETMHRRIIGYARGERIEKGRTTRIDSTAVETNIHYPTDSTLLQDGIRILTRWLMEGKRLTPKHGYLFCDHNRSAKKQVLRIQNAKKEKVRQKAYKELLRLARCVRGYAMKAISVLYGFEGDAGQKLTAYALAEKLEGALETLERVIDQAERRLWRGEKVPAGEKVVSFFECHTDIIAKGNREIHYGHKVVLTGGKSGLIIDCLIERGNPNDAELFEVMIERQKDIYDRPPRQVTADGGFASEDNLERAKAMGVKDVAFAKKRGLSVLEMVKSNWVYKKLRNFRAGIEATISRLKRCFGFERCTWTQWDGFRRYLWSSIVSYNLLVLARLQLAKA